MFRSSILFNSPETFANCLNLGTAALLLQNNASGIILEQSSWKAADAALHFGNLSQFNATQTLRHINTCLSCSGKNQWNCSGAMFYLSQPSYQDPVATRDFVKGMNDTLGSYCSNAEKAVDPDIAGPGVSVLVFH